MAVAAYAAPSGCIVAPSIEAKRFGVKVGMRVRDGKALCPGLIVLAPDPAKYRNVHSSLRKIISIYTDKFLAKSIDEFVLDLDGYPSLARSSMREVARQIKEKIKKEIGEWLTVSIGISTNRFLAKTAAGLRKPDGLEEIDRDNFIKVYSNLSLIDLCGIKFRNGIRLQKQGIMNVLDFYKAPYWQLKAAFESINAYYWYLRLRGWEADGVVLARRSYGNSFALPRPLLGVAELSPILSKLVTKMSARLRRAGFGAKGVHLAVSFRDGSFWHKGNKTDKLLFDFRDFYKEAVKILISCPHRKPVRELSVSAFNLVKNNFSQLDLFQDTLKKKSLIEAVDELNKRWGDFVVVPGRMINTSEVVIDRIAFGQP
ncbi:MAG: hypothetical protein AAB685_01630 [Patescibacteria group bacterium]